MIIEHRPRDNTSHAPHPRTLHFRSVTFSFKITTDSRPGVENNRTCTIDQSFSWTARHQVIIWSAIFPNHQPVNIIYRRWFFSFVAWPYREESSLATPPTILFDTYTTTSFALSLLCLSFSLVASKRLLHTISERGPRPKAYIYTPHRWILRSWHVSALNRGERVDFQIAANASHQNLSIYDRSLYDRVEKKSASSFRSE